MDLLNATKMQAGYTQGMEPSGREHLVVAVKGTFNIPTDGSELQLAEEQVPLVDADTFTGEPGFSAPLSETDYAFRKPRCDVLLHGTAYAPGGKPVTQVRVGLKVGSMTKIFNVVGDRVWKASALHISSSAPKPFVTMPINYGRAFGGFDNFNPDESKHSACMSNPIGRGYHKDLSAKYVDETPLPNTEELDKPITRPEKPYRPMALGPIGRGWEPRLRYAGTYDQNWIDNVFPFLPSDFKDDYYQAAPLDQQIPYPKGGEEVVLVNLTPEGRTAFRLPTVRVPVVFFLKTYDREEKQAVLDTIVIEPDQRRIMLTWRASRALRRNMFEVTQVLVGTKPRGWWRARELGKTYYPSLGEMVRAKKEEEEELA
jgi:hypothetical protein